MIMKELRSVVNINSYGRITVHLKELMKEKDHKVAIGKLRDTRFEVVDKWCSGTVKRIDIDVLARFCYILNCKITDIIRYND